MIYEYKCEKCGVTREEDYPMGHDLPKFLICTECGGHMKHMFLQKARETAVIIPESFKATSNMYQYQKQYGKMLPHEKRLY